MKKLFFTALACVAFAFNGLASNEVVTKLDNINDADIGCRLQVNIVNADGVMEEVLYFHGPLNLSRKSCFEWANIKMDELAEKGLIIEGFQIIRS
nr:hypothetical protein [uncultured Flavobacterium sp.]